MAKVKLRQDLIQRAVFWKIGVPRLVGDRRNRGKLKPAPYLQHKTALVLVRGMREAIGVGQERVGLRRLALP